MKNTIKYTLQKILGIKRYLYWFARYKVKTLKKDSGEMGFFSFLDRIQKPGALLDIGANLGVMSYHYTKRFPDRSVYAFEPVPLNALIFKKIKSKYHLLNVSLFEEALGNENGQIEMVLPEQNDVVLHGLAHVVHESIDSFNEGRVMKVRCTKLDDWVEKNNVGQIAAIKLDVENYESFVLEGAEKTIEKNRPLIYSELWDNQNRIDCIHFLESRNYQTLAVLDSGVVPFDKTRHQTQNFIFAPIEA